MIINSTISSIALSPSIPEAYIKKIPLEIFLTVFEYLELKEVVKCRSICKDYKLILNYENIEKMQVVGRTLLARTLNTYSSEIFFDESRWIGESRHFSSSMPFCHSTISAICNEYIVFRLGNPYTNIIALNHEQDRPCSSVTLSNAKYLDSENNKMFFWSNKTLISVDNSNVQKTLTLEADLKQENEKTSGPIEDIQSAFVKNNQLFAITPNAKVSCWNITEEKAKLGKIIDLMDSKICKKDYQYEVIKTLIVEDRLCVFLRSKPASDEFSNTISASDIIWIIDYNDQLSNPRSFTGKEVMELGLSWLDPIETNSKFIFGIKRDPVTLCPQHVVAYSVTKMHGFAVKWTSPLLNTVPKINELLEEADWSKQKVILKVDGTNVVVQYTKDTFQMCTLKIAILYHFDITKQEIFQKEYQIPFGDRQIVRIQNNFLIHLNRSELNIKDLTNSKFSFMKTEGLINHFADISILSPRDVRILVARDVPSGGMGRYSGVLQLVVKKFSLEDNENPLHLRNGLSLSGSSAFENTLPFPSPSSLVPPRLTKKGRKRKITN